MDANTYYADQQTLREAQLQRKREQLMLEFWRHVDFDVFLDSLQNFATAELIYDIRNVNHNKIGQHIVNYLHKQCELVVNKAMENGNI